MKLGGEVTECHETSRIGGNGEIDLIKTYLYINLQIINTFNAIMCRQSIVYRTWRVHGTFVTVFRNCF